VLKAQLELVIQHIHAVHTWKSWRASQNASIIRDAQNAKEVKHATAHRNQADSPRIWNTPVNSDTYGSS